MRLEPQEPAGPVTSGKIIKTGAASLLTGFGFFGVVQLIDTGIRNISSEPNPTNQFILNMASLGGAALVAAAIGYPMFDKPQIWDQIKSDFKELPLKIKALAVGGFSAMVFFGLTMTIFNSVFFFDSKAHLSPKELFYGSMVFLAFLAVAGIGIARVYFKDQEYQAEAAELAELNADNSKYLAPIYGTIEALPRLT